MVFRRTIFQYISSSIQVNCFISTYDIGFFCIILMVYTYAFTAYDEETDAVTYSEEEHDSGDKVLFMV